MTHEEPIATGGVRLTVAYDGTAFCGWQAQPGQRSVQATLAAAISAVTGETPPLVRGASRTDAGVHALGQAVAFDTACRIPAYGWCAGLGGALPGDVSVVDATACVPGYDPRFDAVDKTYRYLVKAGSMRDPLMRHRAFFLGPPRARPGADRRAVAPDVASWLDLEAMKEAAAHLVGKHDFVAFRSSLDDRQNTVRTLFAIDLIPAFAGDPSLLAIEVHGNAFLRNMVRILAGTLIDVGRHRLTPKMVESLVQPGADRAAAGETAPAHGLTLVSIRLGRRERGSTAREPSGRPVVQDGVRSPIASDSETPAS